MDQDAFLTVGDAAREAGVSRQRVRLLLKAGRIPGAFRLGRDWIIPRAGLEYWLNEDRDRRKSRVEEKGGGDDGQQ